MSLFDLPPVKHMIISPRSQWEEYICPCCNELMDDPVLTSCDHRMCYKCFDKRRRWSFCSWCPVRDDDGHEHKMSWDDWSMDRTAEERINTLLMKCEKCKVKCTVKEYRNFNCSAAHKGINSILISPRSQWEEYICPCCNELMNDPVLTSCGHRMCYKCFDKRRRRSSDYSLLFDPWCPVRDDDGQEHKMSEYGWSRDRTAKEEINKLLVKCDKCKVECTVKEYKKFNCSTAHKGINSILISPRSQWEEYICPCCDELMNDPVQTSCGHRMCLKCFDKKRWSFDDPWCPVRDNDGQEHKMSQYRWSRDRTAEWKINKLLTKCDKCDLECTVKNYRKFDCSTAHDKGINSILISPRSQWEEYICPCCDELMNDPVLTSCGHRMCYECFDERRRMAFKNKCYLDLVNCDDPWCPVRDDVGQEHEMSQYHWSRDWTAEWKINKLLVKCDKCKVECSVKEYRKFHCTMLLTVTQEKFIELRHFLVNNCTEDLPHWKKLLLQHGVITSSDLCGVSDNEFFIKHLPAMECKRKFTILKHIEQCGCPSCKSLSEDLSNIFYMLSNDWSTATADTYTKQASMKTFRELEKLPPDQQQKLIALVLKESLPSAKDDLIIDEIRPLLIQNGVITSEEAAELLGIFSGEEKVTRLYTKMLPNKGLQGLEQYMRILFDTGQSTPSHMRHLGVLLINLSDKLLQIKSNESVLHQYKNEEAAREAIVPMVYSESLPDAVINLSMSINKLLLLMLKKHIISTAEYCWVKGVYYHGKKFEYLYKDVLPQKGVKGLRAFMMVLQDVGKEIPKYNNHRDLLKSSLLTHLTKV